MNNYQPNSHKFKEEQRETTEKKELKKVVTGGTAKVKKKTEARKILDTFISEDIPNLKEFVLMDVIVPTIKKTIVDVVETIFLGGPRDRKRSATTDKISYRNYYERKDDIHYGSSGSRVSSGFDYDDIIFPSRGVADAMIDEMSNVIERYGFVSVGDMYDMAELSAPYTSYKYGWHSVRDADIRRVNEGYIIVLPKAGPREK